MLLDVLDRRRLPSVLFDVAVAGVVAVLALPALTGLPDPWLLAVGVGMAVCLLFRRRAPVVVMLAVAALALGQAMFLDDRPMPCDVAVLVAMYSVVKYGQGMAGAVLAAAVVGVGIVMQIFRHGPTGRWWELAALYVAVWAGAWLTAYTIRTRRSYLASVEERAATAERERDYLARLAVAEERAAIARELHDVVAHSLAVMVVQADGAAYTVDADPGQARDALDTIASTGRDALQDMRLIVGVLRGTADGAASERRRFSVEQLDTLVERARSAGLHIDVDVSGKAGGLAPAEELTVYRIVQEALTNVLRHAGPSARVDLQIAYAPDVVTADVTDDGAGRFEAVAAGTAPGGAASGGAASGGAASGGAASGTVLPGGAGTRAADGVTAGHGLVGMAERAAVHGGEVSVGPLFNGGWRVHARIPLRTGQRADRTPDQGAA